MGLLRKIFGPSKEEVWQQLSDEIGARYVPGTFWKGDKVEAHFGEWTITLDTYTVSTGKTHITYTRMRAPYVNRDGLYFKIYRKGFFSGLGKALGMQDIEVGHPEFDEDFIIQGNDEGKVCALFSNPRIRELLHAQPEVCLEVKDDEGWFGPSFPGDVDELCFHVVGVIKDADRLHDLYNLFAETLNHLCHIGSAYEDDPELSLQ